ncbi:tetratricopeptide repeat protein [bacterium]|nr:tetratricopeptide repeat protein [bacterium]
MNKWLKLGLVILALVLIYPALRIYSVPFRYMQEISNYDSDANLKTWGVMMHFIKEGDALVIIQPDGNYTVQIYEGKGVYSFRYVPVAALQKDFSNLIKEYGRVWVFVYNGVLVSGRIIVPEPYRETLSEQYQACFTLPLFFGETAYLQQDDRAKMARALFSQQLLDYISDIAKEVDYRDLAIFFQKAGQYENAKSVLSRALTLFPNSPMLYRTLAEVYVASQNLEAYEEIYDCNRTANALTRSETGKANITALFQNAIYTARKGLYEKARTLYFSLLSIFGNQADPVMESQVRRYFVKDVLLPTGDTNEAISQLLVDINLGAQNTEYDYNLLLDILDKCAYSNAAVSLGYGFFKSTNHQHVESAVRYGSMVMKYGTDAQFKEALDLISERNRYNPLLLEKLRLQREWFRNWTNMALSKGYIPFEGAIH